MILTDEERKKFIEWCRQETASCKALEEQLKKMGLVGTMKLIAQIQHARGAAAKIVGDVLESVELQTIGGFVNYLLKTPKGVFLVEAPDYNKACEYARLSGCAEQDQGIQMLGRFLDKVRYAQQLNTTGIVICEPDILKKAINGYMVEHVQRSWMGSRDAESHEQIKQELEEATTLLEHVTGLSFRDT